MSDQAIKIAEQLFAALYFTNELDREGESAPVRALSNGHTGCFWHIQQALMEFMRAHGITSTLGGSPEDALEEWSSSGEVSLSKGPLCPYGVINIDWDCVESRHASAEDAREGLQTDREVVGKWIGKGPVPFAGTFTDIADWSVI